MRAVQLVEPGRLEVQEVPVPEAGPGEVLVRVAGSGLCHSDLHLLALPEWPVPDMTLGHETAGRVAALGAGVTGFDEGEAVLVNFVWSCGACRPCREGRDNVCMSEGRMGMPPAPGLGLEGGMADYMKVDARYLHKLGDLDPTTAAPLADAGLTPLHAVNGARHRLGVGNTAVVIGVGGLGHMGLQYLRATSGVRIVAVDVSQDKLEQASRLGADATVLAGDGAAAEVLDLTEGSGADAVFDFVGNQTTLDQATEMIAADGALRLIGIAGGHVTCNAAPRPTTMPWGVDVRATYAGTRADLEMAISLAQLGRVHSDVTTYPLEDIHKAVEDLRAGRVEGRAVLIP